MGHVPQSAEKGLPFSLGEVIFKDHSVVIPSRKLEVQILGSSECDGPLFKEACANVFRDE